MLVRAVGLVGSGTKATVSLPTQGKVNEIGITLRRGYNVLAIDGPGQGGALHLQKLVMRPDWEAVITPVVDYALARREIEPDRRVRLQPGRLSAGPGRSLRAPAVCAGSR